MARGWNFSLALSDTTAGFISARVSIPSSSSLSPFAPPAFTGFLATMATLTPARIFSIRAGIPASRICTSDRSVTNHPWRPAVAFARYPSAQQASRFRVWASSILRRLTTFQAELCSSFPFLRTSLSLPVAPHPVLPPMQLLSVTGRRASARSGLSPLCTYAPTGARRGAVRRDRAKTGSQKKVAAHSAPPTEP